MEFTDAPLEPFGQELLTISVPSQLGFKTPLVFRLMKLLKDNGYLPATGTHMAELCFEEVLANSILHGNQQDPDKKIKVQVYGDGDRWCVIIEDEGEGFGADQVPDPNDPDALFREGGRGIMLMDQFVDELRYNTKGNKVMLVRAKQTKPDASVAPSAATAVQKASALPNEPAVPATGGKVDLSDAIELDVAAAATEAASASDGPVATSEVDGIRVVTLHVERLTEDNVSQVQEPLYTGCEFDGPVVLDLAGLEFLSSVGISTILTANKKVMQAKRKIVLAGATPAVIEIFNATGVGKLLKFESDVNSAVAAAKS